MHSELVLKNKLSEIAQLEAFVEDLGDGLQLDIPAKFNLNLVLEEVVANVISYAFPADEEHSFVVKADGMPGEALTLQVVDDGVPFNPLKEAPDVDITLDVEERPVGGLGIFLVRQIMDEVSYEYAGGNNILTMRKLL